MATGNYKWTEVDPYSVPDVPRDVNILAKEIDTSLKSEATSIRTSVSAQDTRIKAVEQLGGLAPGSVSDATVASLVAQSGTSTRTNLDGRYPLKANTQITAGFATITLTAANTPASVTVTFPAGRFSAAPSLVPTPNSTAPGTISLSTSGVTASAATIWATRASTGDVTVYWIAANRG